MTESKQEDYIEYGHLCHDVLCWCQDTKSNGHKMLNFKKSKWHGTTINESLYRTLETMARKEKRSVIKQIEYVLEKGLLFIESEQEP